MCRVKAANQLISEDEGGWREIGIFLQEWERDVGKTIKRQRAAKHDTPQFCMSWVLANALESIEMFFMQTVGKSGEKTYGIANVKTAYYVGKDKFTKNISVRETFLGDNLFCFRCLLRWTFKSHQASGDSRLNGNRRRTVVFCRTRSSA